MGKAHRLAARRRVMLKIERDLWATGVEKICGVDEVGVGPLAGPLVAAAVILPREVNLRGVDDSKRLSAARRAEMVPQIREAAVAWAVGEVSAAEVDHLNTYRAAMEAMRRAVLALTVVPQHILVDARAIPGVEIPQWSIVKGDRQSISIAAASIIAKEHRDQMMRQVDEVYPDYGFGRHMGYGTRAHLEALDRLGPCPEHRRSFAPVQQTRFSFASERDV